MTNMIIKSYDSFNFRRYTNPWIASVKDGKPDFSKKIGGYTGGYMKGEAGDLYISDPEEGTVYMYGQKDHRGNNTANAYIKIVNSEAVPCDKLGRV